ncbi:hypothetical protein SPBR_09174 [Sporothrix brasiliensis 5110]|uniref:Uncharacterized protein n=1 Tax=Sporothrix brasiliensis 5110 TaxID=1398154 RepID=A0A0C2J390_9PEZI|nr:uncharacterized protein SPBR_09174 [Sporothrix brasiliensis 5110]KIH93490.1 hypothetical protein SPBR_09174 [Sporothrix brasiliensis 5110]
MASGRHIDSESPMFFGYSIGDDFPFLQNAPEPAPGAPLLSDTEQNDLNNWFENMKSDDRINDNVTGNAIHSENWIDIPQFVGSSSSFGQPQDLQHASLGNHVLPQDVYDNLPITGLVAIDCNICRITIGIATARWPHWWLTTWCGAPVNLPKSTNPRGQ